MKGQDLLVVISDSGKLSFLTFCREMNRFLPVKSVQLSSPGNSRNQLGRMLTVDSAGGFVAVSAYEDRFALFSVSVSVGSYTVDQCPINPPDNGDTIAGRSFQKPYICGTIWSMCFLSNHPSKEHDTVLAILLNRKGASLNELLLFGWNVRENELRVLASYGEVGPLALNLIEVPHLHGFAFLMRLGDVLLMDLRDTCSPCCIYRTSLNSLPPIVEESDVLEETCSVHDFSMDDEGSNDAACALLKLRDHDPMCIDDDDCNAKSSSRYVCSWSWEPGNSRNQRMIFCVDTGELFIIEVSSDFNGLKVNLSECLYRDLPCKALLWVEGGYLAAIVEMGDGKILKFENGKLTYTNPIESNCPILDMSLADFHDEKQDQIFVCCGVAPEGSLRIIRSGINVEKLLKTASIYQGITGIWTMKMKVTDSYHSFLVLSFVEETRVLSVGLSFTDVTDAVGFQPDVCTSASGLVGDGWLIQIHRSAVRLCLPTKAAHSEGISSSSPICATWSPSNVGISMGAVGHRFVVVSTSNPCLLIVLGIKVLSTYQYELIEVHHLRFQSEISCISVPQNYFGQEQSWDIKHAESLPHGVHIGNIIVVGTHRPSVEVVSIIPDQGLRVIASGTILLTSTMGTVVSGCIPQDVRLVLVDKLYVLSGLRNGMLLRFEWPTASWMNSSELLCHNSSSSSYCGDAYAAMSEIKANYFGRGVSTGVSSGKFGDSFPIDLQLIATRRIGITPVFLVPLSDSLDSDMIALSDRPWLLQTARHSLSFTSISFQPSTHVTPVCSAECTKGVLFVAENSLHLVEMVHSKRLNVQKFQIEGTPRKVLYHSDSRLLLVMRTELNADTCTSDICCVDPHSGFVLSTYKLDPEEIGKCMELVRVGREQVVVIGTSLSSGPAVMPSGEAESTKGRLIVLCLERMQNSYGGPLAFFRKAGSFSQCSSPFCESVGYATEQLSSSSFCSNEDDINCEGIKLEESEVWQLRLAYATTWTGRVLAVCPYVDHLFLASAGNAFYVCGFINDNPQKVKRYAMGRTRFMITSLTSHLTRIAVGDCRDGILFYTYHEDGRKLEQDYSDPSQRLVADCTLVDVDTAVVSDRKGSIAVLSSPDRTEDNASPESNLTLSCAYYMGEIGMSITKGSFSYKLPADDVLKASDNSILNVDLARKIIIVSTLLGSITVFIPISRDEYELLEAVQAKLAVHPLTAPVLGNNHNEFRSREKLVGIPKVLDGDLLSQFLELTSMQQEAVLSLPLCAPETVKLNSVPFSPIPVNQVVQLLERVHYALN
ncbi:hypothetical protein BT93_F0461 [Corymbia citriodora subsp. variegata]|nr:hypothetical protein BT93_F0461 [Corymbia citriodora subsp. variegata]KAF8022951.1 hypothetical protein BT93_F0461 [Corymbia citriodora subsp. variegata]